MNQAELANTMPLDARSCEHRRDGGMKLLNWPKNMDNFQCRTSNTTERNGNPAVVHVQVEKYLQDS